jgi:hypothetical protein
MTGDVTAAFGDTDLILPSGSPAVGRSKEHILRYTLEVTVRFLERQQDRRMYLMKV